MTKKIIIPLLAITLLLSCKKQDTQVAAGKVSMNIKVKHHQVSIPYCKVFIKYNTLTFPGKDTTLYDSFVVTDQNGFVKLDNLGNGQNQYIVYAKGIDASWDITHTTPVWGFQPVSIDTKPGEAKEVNVTIPVSE